MPPCEVCGKNPMVTTCAFCGKAICAKCRKVVNLDGVKHDSCKTYN